MPPLDRLRWRQRPTAALIVTSALLFAAYAPIGLSAAPTEAGDRKQKLEELRDTNASAQRDATEMRHQLDELQGEAIDRGLLMTLDDAVFTTNNADLSTSGQRRLNALVVFLKQHPQRAVAIDAYAGAGDYRYDQALSKRRAEAVKAYLIRQEIAPSRLTARGSGTTLLDAEDSATEQQTIRRVEVIIEDPVTAPRT